MEPAQGAANAFYAEPVMYQPQQAIVPAVAPQPGAQALFAAVQGAQQPQGALIEGTFLVNGFLAKILFDSGASHSFIARSFMIDIGLIAEHLWILLEISLPVGRLVL